MGIALPPGFTVDKPTTGLKLPAGFTLDKAKPPAETYEEMHPDDVSLPPGPANPANPLDGLALPVPGSFAQPTVPEIPPNPMAEPPQPQPQDDQQSFSPMRGLSLGLQAANKGMIADTLGAPMGILSLLYNGIASGVNLGGRALGNKTDVLPQWTDPIGGSQGIANAGEQAFQMLTGHEQVHPETDIEKLIYNTIEVASSAVVPEAFGTEPMRMLAKMIPANEVAAPTTNVGRIFKSAAPLHDPSARSIYGATMAGAGAGAAQGAYEQFAPEEVKNMPVVGPGLDLLSMLAGAVGGGITGEGARIAKDIVVNPIRDTYDTLTRSPRAATYTGTDGTVYKRRTLDAGADYVQNIATNPGKAVKNIDNNLAELAGSVANARPTVDQLSGDIGLRNLGKRQRMNPEMSEAFIANDHRVRDAALDNVATMAPETAIGRTFTDTADQMQADKVAAARAAAEAKQAEADLHEQQLMDEGNSLAASRSDTAAASGRLDKVVVDDTMRPMQEESARRYSAVDPERSAIIDSTPLLDAAKSVRDNLGTLNDPAKVIPAGLLKRLESTEGGEVDTGLLDPSGKPIFRDEPNEVSIGDITAVYPELAVTETRARKAGNTNLADNIRALRNSMDKLIEDTASRTPKPDIDGSPEEIAKALNIEFPVRPLGADREKSSVPGLTRLAAADRQTGEILVSEIFHKLPAEKRRRILAHEAGHLRFPADIESLTGVPMERALKQMTAGSQMIRPTVWKKAEKDAKTRTYVSSPSELIADAHALYIVDRESAKRLMPDMVKLFDETVPQPLPGEQDRIVSAAQRLLAAKGNYAATVGKVFGSGPGDEGTILRKDVNLDRHYRSESPPEDTAGRFLQPGKPQKSDSLARILDASPNPDEGRAYAADYLRSLLASSGAIDSSGKINPSAIAKWRAQWGGQLDQLPNFKKELDDLQSGAEAGKQATARLRAEIEDQKRLVAEAERNDTAFKHVVGKNPVNAVAGIFSKEAGDPERVAREIVAKIGKGSAAHDALKKAVVEYFQEKGSISARQATETGDRPLSWKFLDEALLPSKEKALSEIFEPEEMAHLQDAHKLLKALKMLEDAALTGSQTAEKLSNGDKMMKLTEIALKMAHGTLRGGGEMRNIRLAAAMRGGGPDAVEKLIAEIQFNPELAKALLTRDVSRFANKKFDSAMFRNVVLAGVARDYTDGGGEDKKKPVEITVTGGNPALAAEH